MNPFLVFWNTVFIHPIFNVLMAFYKLAEWLHLPGPLGFAIIFMTIFFRLILYPLTNAQLKSARDMAKLKPHLDELTKKHKDDKAALQQAQLALYKEHNINPAAGCIPMLIQMPALIALYNVFYQFFGANDVAKMIVEINNLLYIPALKITSIDFTFFGGSLGWKPDMWQKHGWWLLLIPVITGGLQWYQSKLMLPVQPKPSDVPPTPTTKKLSVGSESVKTEEKKTDDMAEMQKQMALMMPIMFGFFSYSLPIGLALYWNIFGLFGIMQQLKVNKK
jgi:YidC/Oxa1 family membrane protein insertase